MPIKMLRIDDRLIHGQIVTAWAKNIQAEKIWIVDDGVTKDDFVKGIMHMVAPGDRELIITGLADMPSMAEKLDSELGNTLILVKFPYVAKEIFKAGIKLNELNIGGIGASPERQKLFKNISASEAEKQTLKEIQDMGINVFFQVTPDEKRTQFSYEK